jgi:hypothetical protein
MEGTLLQVWSEPAQPLPCEERVRSDFNSLPSLAANICPETVKIPDAKRVGRR